MFCRNCGQSNDDYALFCVSCGQPLENAGQQEHIHQTAPKRSRKPVVVLVAGIACMIVAICVILTVFALTKKDTESGDSSGWQSLETEDTKELEEDETEQLSEESAKETTEEASEEAGRDAQPEVSEEAEVSYATIEECVEICESMGRLEDSHNANYELLRSMADVALQMEYVKSGNGEPQKQYTKLQADDELILLSGIINNFSSRSEAEDYHMWKSVDSNSLFEENAAKRLVKDFYGNDDLDLSEFSYFEDYGDGYWSSTCGDGDPWYEFVNYSIKENEDFYLLEGACAYGDNSGDMYFVGYAKYLFVKNVESLLGVTLVYSEFDHQENVNLAVSAAASSELEPQGNKTYKAAHLIDNNLNTCWVEGVSGTGEGETIELDLGREQTVYGLIICNGYLESKYLYGINGKVAAVTVRASDGTVKQAALMTPEFDEAKEPFERYESLETENWIRFDRPVDTDKIIITIDDAVTGSKYEDTCISEIKVY